MIQSGQCMTLPGESPNLFHLIMGAISDTKIARHLTLYFEIFSGVYKYVKRKS
jgi:hypothetical protein